MLHGLLERLDVVKTAIVGSVADVVTNLKSGFSDMVENLKYGFSVMVSTILVLRDDIVDKFERSLYILSHLVDSLTDAFKLLFVPDKPIFGELYQVIKDKFPLIDQIGRLLSAVVFSGSGTPSDFKITYFGVTASIVDFQDFRAFIPFIHGLIIALAYFKYFSGLYKRLPGIIWGFTSR